MLCTVCATWTRVHTSTVKNLGSVVMTDRLRFSKKCNKFGNVDS